MLVIAEQYLHGVKAFSAPARRLGVHKKLGGDTARTADPNWPKACPAPYHVVLSIKSWGKKKEGGKFGVMPFCLPKSLLRVMEPCFPGNG